MKAKQDRYPVEIKCFGCGKTYCFEEYQRHRNQPECDITGEVYR